MGLRETITAASDPTAAMHRVLEAALVLVPSAGGAAVELCAGPDQYVYAATAGFLAGDLGTEVPRDGSLSGLAVESATTQRCDDTNSDPRVDRQVCGALGIASMICVPLIRAHTTVGVLKVASATTACFDAADEAVLGELAEFVAVVIGAAVELSSVTAKLLDAGNQQRVAVGALRSGSVDAVRHARHSFVADVIQPGAVVDANARTRIERTLADGGLMMAVQPVFSLPDHAVVEVEALARFTGPPERTPDLWFAEAAAVGLGLELELLAVERALELLPRLPPSVRLAVNAGPSTFCAGALVEMLRDTDADRVVVELTEHVDIEDYPALHRACLALRDLGTKVAIDDTGNGFASLSLILEVGPEIIKLDRRLTAGIDLDPIRRALASALVTFGNDTAAEVVAEGIETEGELQTLTELGIARGQGFYLARPGTLEDVLPLLARAGPDAVP
ncbi:MAG: EAL domain-containing protein [Actinomycetota bacterium]|nr:EAL domain-containing protein [Actinomycetota bacterium]MDA8341831.1 EAL domain-containing protein [Actinomycetota bacterium]